MRPTIDQQMGNAYERAGVPLWVTPSEVVHYLACNAWSMEIAHELGEWFARVWSMAYAAGYKGLKGLVVDSGRVHQTLLKMGYCEARALELAQMMADKVPGLYAKGRSMAPLGNGCEQRVA